MTCLCRARFHLFRLGFGLRRMDYRVITQSQLKEMTGVIQRVRYAAA